MIPGRTELTTKCASVTFRIVPGKNRTFTIPAGVQVFTSLFHLHRNPKCFPDPLKFDPERFLDDNAPHKAYAFAFVPFSGGPRNCVGQKFAMNEAKVRH